MAAGPRETYAETPAHTTALPHLGRRLCPDPRHNPPIPPSTKSAAQRLQYPARGTCHQHRPNRHSADTTAQGPPHLGRPTAPNLDRRPPGLDGRRTPETGYHIMKMQNLPRQDHIRPDITVLTRVTPPKKSLIPIFSALRGTLVLTSLTQLIDHNHTMAPTRQTKYHVTSSRQLVTATRNLERAKHPATRGGH